MKKIVLIITIALFLAGCENERDRYIDHLESLGYTCLDYECYMKTDETDQNNNVFVSTKLEEHIYFNSLKYQKTYFFMAIEGTNRTNPNIVDNYWEVDYDYLSDSSTARRVINGYYYDYNHQTQLVTGYRKSTGLSQTNYDTYDCRDTNKKDFKEVCNFLKDKCNEFSNYFKDISRDYDLKKVMNEER